HMDPPLGLYPSHSRQVLSDCQVLATQASNLPPRRLEQRPHAAAAPNLGLLLRLPVEHALQARGADLLGRIAAHEGVHRPVAPLRLPSAGAEAYHAAALGGTAVDAGGIGEYVLAHSWRGGRSLGLRVRSFRNHLEV